MDNYKGINGETLKLNENINDLKTLLIIELQQPQHLKPDIHDIPTIQQLPHTISSEIDEELTISKDAISEWSLTYANTLQVHLKPELFPIELWKYVQDDDKPRVKMKWNSFKPERLRELIDQVMNLEIDKSTPGRALEEPIVRAQCLAWLDRYGHPDPHNPPRIEGHECRIELLDHNINRFVLKRDVLIF